LPTDGLIEGRAATGGSARLGMDGLIALLAGIKSGARWAQEPRRSSRTSSMRSSSSTAERCSMTSPPCCSGAGGAPADAPQPAQRGTWPRSAPVLAVATLVAIGAALIARIT
jgi:hypothetical protein